ncbi:unnamed protein product [Chilo suppressalis]|uniref:Swi5-dependent recombination DNA repair protein 1 homolog n=1 Tax=Chilo suppressalis TaxID=168631 RepID=A0ABN8B3Z6_CHISP|nr:unnamed protein product [Chilo suppressalis]
MKTVSSLKSNSKVESPKTPGGISKSLLTPCRRVGLSRNWRNKGPSPFISPLSGNTETKIESIGTSKKRKHLSDEEVSKEPEQELSSKECLDNSQNNKPLVTSTDIDTTPSRNISIPQRKRSKTLITSKIDNSITETQVPETHFYTFNEKENVEVELNKGKIENIAVEEKVVTTPSRTNSNTIRKSKRPTDSVQSFTTNNSQVDYSNKVEDCSDNNIIKDQQKVCEKKSPENLTKECIVLIQKKIFKKDIDKIKQCNKLKTKDVNPVSQTLFDSDSDDVPLSILNKKNESKVVEPTIINLDDDDDFTESTKVKVKKLEDKTTSTGGLHNKTNVKKKSNKQTEVVQKLKTESVCLEPKPSQSQSSFDDDEDFAIDKRTILIRKSYEKVTKPSKAKSTGSITQKDIDNIKARIEIKKKLLLAKAMTEDTEELRELVKKWQKGCQDAVMELMQLIRQKFPDKQNMDYSEILSSLKIPVSMVGYDEENDSFITPTDEDIILAKFRDL